MKEVCVVDYSLLGKRIREERLRLNLTQEKLAEDINNSQLMMCEVEVVIKELYEQVQIASEKEYRAALAQQEADSKAVEEKQEE